MAIRTSAVALFVLGSMLFASAQAPRSGDAADAAIAALVTELRAVRVELTEASQRSLRFQLLLARVQLQEQRISHLDRQRAEIVKSLMDASTVASLFSAQFDQMARGCAESSGVERKACDEQVTAMKGTLAGHQTREQQLRQQEQELMQAIGTEQGRWSEFSARLDDLERALSRTKN
jgi:hypothetical protein